MIEPVIIEPYNPQWQADFGALRAVYQTYLSRWLLAVEHVGSTSVVGLAAKPVLDIDLVIATPADLPPVIAALAELGYVHRGDQGIPTREAFRQTSGYVPADGSGRVWPKHHLYVCPQDSPALKDHLLLRDYLRQHPAKAQAYSELKQTLAATFRTDRLGYTEAKTTFILGTLAEAAKL